MRDTVFQWLGAILWLVVIGYLEVFGLIHSFTSHNKSDTIASFLIPPLAWYRAVEYWWHDDFPGVNWTQRIDGDATLIGFLMNSSHVADPETKKKSIEAIDFVRARIETYPTERREEIKSMSLAYCEFVITLGSELREHFQVHSRSEFIPPFHPSPSLENQARALEPYPQLYDLWRTNLDAVQLLAKGTFRERDEEEIESILEAFDLSLARTKRTMATTFENIFGTRPRFAPSSFPDESPGPA